MQRVLAFILLLAVVKTENELKKVEGTWTGVMLFTDDTGYSTGCHSLKFKATEESCKCGKEQVGLLELTVPDSSQKPKIPTIYITSKEDLLDAVETTCKCDGIISQHVVFLSQNPNYISMYVGGFSVEEYTVLLAKEVPSEKEIEDFAEHAEDLKDRHGVIICSSEDSTRKNKRKSNPNATKLWYQLRQKS